MTPTQPIRDRWDEARWEGQIEARVADAERRLDTINGHIRELGGEVRTVRSRLDRWAGALLFFTIVTPFITVGLVLHYG